MVTRTEKRKAADASNPLLKPVILNHMLAYVGPGQWHFLATVCSAWRDAYALVAIREVERIPYVEDDNGDEIECTPQMTLYSSMFASSSRLVLAKALGVKFKRLEFAFAAGKHADVATLEAAYDLGMKRTEATMSGATTCNDLTVLQYLHAEGCALSADVCDAAAVSGDLEMLRWAREQGAQWEDDSILAVAAGSGNVELAAWVQQQPGVVVDSSAMTAAAKSGDIAMCEHLHLQQCSSCPDAACAAAEGWHWDTLRWLQEHGCPWHQSVCNSIAESGELEVLQWVREQQGAEAWDTQTILQHAASSGSVELAAWVMQQPGVAVNCSAMSAAAERGHTAMCAYLHEQQCEFGLGTCCSAADNAHWDTLRWLQEHGCPWHQSVYETLAERGEFELLRWAREQGPAAWDTQTILQHAASSGSVELTAWVMQHAEVDVGALAMRFAAAEGHTAVCELLHAQQCPMDWSVADAGAESGDVPTLRFLLEHGCPTYPLSLCIHAARGGSIEAMQLVQQQPDTELSAAVLTGMLNAAGACGQLDACLWLRAQGAAWPALLHDMFWKRCMAPWSGAALAWARAEGCDSPTNE
jgi:hypothetical protein